MNKVSARLNNVGFYVKVTIDVTNNATYTPESGLKWRSCYLGFTYTISLWIVSSTAENMVKLDEFL